MTKLTMINNSKYRGYNIRIKKIIERCYDKCVEVKAFLDFDPPD